MTKALIRALKGETLSPPPFWLMRQAGRYLPEYRRIRKEAKNFLDFCYTPDLAVEVTLQPLRRYSLDAAILFSDILVIPDALGQKVEFQEGRGPVLDPINDVADLTGLSIDRLHDHLSPVYETVRRLAKEIPPETALIGFAGAPWTVAVYMVEGRGKTDCQRIKSWASETPREFARLIDLLIEATAAYLTRQVNNGAEVLQLFDSWAGLLKGEQFDRWIIQPNARIVERLRETCPGVPIIGFPRNAGDQYEDFITGTGVDGIGMDETVALDQALALQEKCTVQGNLSNRLLVEGGSALDQGVRDILQALDKGPFIFNLGHGIVPETPPENVARVAEIIASWKGQKAVGAKTGIEAEIKS